MKLKTKVVALSLLTLLLPWSGWKLLQELEQYLRESQETALLASARIVAGAMPLEFQTRLLFAPDHYVLLRELDRQPSLDGYADDWPDPEQGLEFRPDAGAIAIRLLAGSLAGRLYLLFDVEAVDSGGRPGLAPSAGAAARVRAAGITLFTRSPRGLHRFTIRPGAPGPLQLRSETGEAGQGEGYWLDTPAGYRVELSLPAGDENTDISLQAAGSAEPGPDGAAALSAVAGPTRWIRLVEQWASLSDWLSRAAGGSSRAWMVDADGWVLADSALADDAAGGRTPAALTTTWLQRLAYRLVADAQMELRDDWPAAPVRLSDAAVTRALAGEDAIGWSQDLDTAVVRNTAAVPLVLDGKVRGAVALQSSSDGLLLVTNRALGSLVFTTLALTIGLAAGLWYFASRLSGRVRRLSGAVSHAMEVRADPDSLPLRRDRDELGELARNTEKLLRAVADYSQYLQTLAGKLSHELKTPLAITRSSLDNLSSKDLDAESRRFLQRAQEGVERQAAIVRAMSEASRLEAAIDAAEWERVDLTELVTRCAAGYRTVHEGRRLDLRVPSGATPLECAPDLLAQALDKLVDNAFSLIGPEDQVAIDLRRAGDVYELAVRNTGTTLPDDFKERLFDSLVSLRAKRGAEPHLGLGLYIVRLVVAAHEGEVTARNLPGDAGVEFLMRLPRN
jgi:signal transduction histidine kinase